jgi:hypothetical protein
MALHAMHYFMGRSIATVDGTGRDACNSLHNSPLLPYDLEKGPKLLIRQIKHSMHSLLQETTREVLDALEKELKTRSKASWAPCFRTIAILCICIEELQVAIDGFVVQKITQKRESKCTSREDAHDIARKLDDLFYTDCKTLFHDIYRSCRTKKGRKYEQSFNPIRDGVKVDQDEGNLLGLQALIGDIHEILGTYGIVLK